MSTPFLLAYSHRVVHELLRLERLVLVEQSTPEDVVRDVAATLASRQGHSLISSTSMGIIRSDHVDDLFADDDEIKEIVNRLG